jgi:hypothetical protein
LRGDDDFFFGSEAGVHGDIRAQAGIRERDLGSWMETASCMEGTTLGNTR